MANEKRNLTKSIYALLMLFILISSSCTRVVFREERVPALANPFEQEIIAIYNNLNFDDTLRFEIFKNAMIGHHFIEFDNKNILTIIDFSQPSTDKRCYIIDLAQKKVLYNTLVAHGRNSGENYATEFSNIRGSKQSSLGFYKTSGTYTGSNGYSLYLDGLEKDINHLAREREIVIHGADYVSQEFIDENGRLGRSWGCPAFPRDLSTEIIDVIKDGSCLYIYADDPAYLSRTLYIPEKITSETVVQ